jgi:hypothetical protein
MAKTPEDVTFAEQPNPAQAAGRAAFTKNTDKPAAPKTRQVVVGEGRSVVYQKNVGTDEDPVMVNAMAGAGAIIDVPVNEAAFLQTHGFLQAAPTPPPEPSADRERAEAMESQATINGQDGNTIRPG